MADIRKTLDTACQSLRLLNADGFPTVATCEIALRDGTDEQVLAAAKLLVERTGHISLPSLNGLRGLLANPTAMQERRADKGEGM